MSQLIDLIKKQVNASAGEVDLPQGEKENLLGGLSDSIMGSLKSTALQKGGLDKIKDLFGGKVNAADSPITGLAGEMFKNNVLSKLNLGSGAMASLTGLVPKIMGNLSNFIKDRDGDGDVDLKDILASLTGGGSSLGGGLFSGILGKLFGRK